MSGFKVGDKLEVLDNTSGYEHKFNIGDVVTCLRSDEYFTQVRTKGGEISNAYTERFKKVEEKTLPAMFTFIHKDDASSIVFKAEVVGSIVNITWEKDGNTTYPTENVERFVAEGIWIIQYPVKERITIKTFGGLYWFTEINDTQYICTDKGVEPDDAPEGQKCIWNKSAVNTYIVDGTWHPVSSPSVEELKKELADAEENYRNVMDAAIKRVVDAKTALRIAKGE